MSRRLKRSRPAPKRCASTSGRAVVDAVAVAAATVALQLGAGILSGAVAVAAAAVAMRLDVGLLVVDAVPVALELGAGILSGAVAVAAAAVAMRLDVGLLVVDTVAVAAARMALKLVGHGSSCWWGHCKYCLHDV